MANEIRLPKLKENVDTVEVQEVLVSPGQTVEKDQPLIVVNADKSNMEVYAPFAGKVVRVNVKVGDEVKIGTVYCVLEGGNGEAPSVAEASATQVRKDEHTDEPRPRDVKPARQESVPTPTPAPTRTAPRTPAPGLDAPPAIIPASPATRWLARKLGVDLALLRGSGPRGRITEEDVKAAHVSTATGGPAAVVQPALPNFEEYGPIQREPLTRVRKLTAQKMAQAWSLIPHVTQHDLADITDLEAFRKSREGKLASGNGKPLKLTVLAFVLKACVHALKQFPIFNSTLDLASNQLILKKHYHLGVAVDTKSGLLVPVIRDVDRKGVEDLARELAETGEKARNGKADMAGGTFTITNLGGIGGTAFTPIINYPEVAILGLSRSTQQPVVRDGQIVPRLMLPLSLSYDHRVIDGADAARFTRLIAEMLENPWMMLLKS